MNGSRVCGLPLILGSLAVLVLCGCAEKHPRPVETPPPVVEVATPVQKEVIDYALFTARTQATQAVDIKPRVTGYLTEIGFKDGDTVKAGDLLFKIDDRTYKAQLDKAKADVEFQKASLVKAQAEYDIGLDVQKNNPGAISKDQLAKLLGSRDEAKGALDSAKASVESAQLYYDWCTIRSPISGRIDRHFVDAGNLVSQDVTVLTNVVTLKPIWAYFYVDENSARAYRERVRAGTAEDARDKAIPVEMALGFEKDFSLKGTIDFIANQLDPTVGSIQVRAAFPNDKGGLVAGMFGRIRVPMGNKHEALLVAEEAIGTDQGKRYILVVTKDDTVEYREVEVGQAHGGLREVFPSRRVGSEEITVLSPDDRVIVTGLQRARPGGKVQPKQVDMASGVLDAKPPVNVKTK